MSRTVEIYRGVILLALLCSCIPQTANSRLNDIEICSDIIAYNGEAYFCGNHALKGKEVFRTNGTQQGTSVVKDIDPGPGSSSPNAFFEYKGFMFFIAETTLTGWALWRSDGTSVGTKIIRQLDLNPNQDIGGIRKILDIDGELLVIFANVLLRTDGTNSGTTIVNAINGYLTSGTFGSTSFIRSSTLIFNNGLLYFNSLNLLYKMELSDSTPTLIKEFPGGFTGFYPAQIVENSLSQGSFLIANTDHLTGNSIWQSDGTTSGTIEIASNISGFQDSFYQTRQVVDAGYLYCDHSNGNLYVRAAGDSASTLIFKNFQSQCQINVAGKTENSLILQADGALWITAGTSDSTKELTRIVTIKELYNGVYKSPNGYLFSGDSGVVGSELWRIDGSSTETQKLKNFIRAGIRNFSTVSGGVFFTVDSRDDYQLWHSNGTSSGTILVKNIPRYIEGPRWTEGHRLYFTIDDKLWHSDGTPDGTYKLLYPTPDEPGIDLNPLGSIFPMLMLLLDDCEPAAEGVCN